ncbi:MAG: acyl carrier protein [Candidatus Marinimicrobia bacterium]|jgi:acyl carrier protein|nr:acyl carrier protein [Candidatus Neomarinimicrobiota bacterium]
MHNSQKEIYLKVVLVFEKLFEIDADKISLESNLYEDLDIDSIDAVDLVIELRKMTGKKIQPEDFKSVRTVQDIVDQVEILLANT